MRRAAAIAPVAAAFVVLLVLVRTAWSPLASLDRTVARALGDATSGSPAWTAVWKAVSDAGQPLTWQVMSVVAALLLWRAGRVTSAGFAAATVLLAGLLSRSVKLLVDRARPPDGLVQASGSSFPSGHALSSLVGVVVLLVVAWPSLSRRGRPWAVTAGAFVVAAIGVSRLALRAHYLSDVLAGWLLGGLWTLVCLEVLRRVQRPTA